MSCYNRQNRRSSILGHKIIWFFCFIITIGKVTVAFKNKTNLTNIRRHVQKTEKYTSLGEDPMKYTSKDSSDIKISVWYINQTNMQLIELLLCGISVVQSAEILCEPANNLNETFPALIFHIKKFKPTGTKTLQFHIC